VARDRKRPTPLTNRKSTEPSPFWFLGPKSEHADRWGGLFAHIFRDYCYWRRNYWPSDPAVGNRHLWKDEEAWLITLSDELDKLLDQLKADFPFFHPRYLAHMTSEQTLPAFLGYVAGMLYNPNNVTVEAAPVTIDHELEAAQMVAEMLGFDPEQAWGHITAGGTVATLEALWVSRHVQFAPFALKPLCVAHCGDFEVSVDGPFAGRALEGMSPDELLGLPPSVSAELPVRLRERLERDGGSDASRLVTDALMENPVRLGTHAIAECTGQRRPVVFASEAAHYSVRKACSVLGFGSALELVPLTTSFRMDSQALRKRLLKAVADPDRYVAAVVATAGSTEFGAVDDVTRVVEIRSELEAEHGASFWIHVDAAWGGYLASVFRNRVVERRPPQAPLLSSAFARTDEADSVTVDPHKLGYVPYPAGMVLFGNRRLPAFVEEEATYISEASPTAVAAADGPSLDERLESIGPFSLEGSKPGAAAAACWLAHQTIPLEASWHGSIIESTLEAAQYLAKQLKSHRKDDRFDLRVIDPSTNIVCYLVVPPREVGGASRLSEINRINGRVHKRLGQPAQPRAVAAHAGDGRRAAATPLATPHAHPYFISRTVLSPSHYSWQSIGWLLEELGVEQPEFDAHPEGLVVLRSTVMNPHYRPESSSHQRPAKLDYLKDFVTELYHVAGEVVRDLR
jgi:glutamate/tyrosine decarboxylase-like PLP-dependent enzyme